MDSIQGSNYNISSLEYPNDLHDNSQYGGNKVIFFINEHKASKFNKAPNETVDLQNLDTTRAINSVVGRPLSSPAMTIAGMAPSAITGGILLSLFKGSILPGAAALTAASGLALNTAGTIGATTTREMKRLTAAIALHMPNDLSIRYGVNWSDDDMAGSDMAAAGMNILGEEGAGMMKSLSDMNISQLVQNVKGAVNNQNNRDFASAAVTNLALSNVPGGSYVSAKTGVAPNPKREMIFKSVDFRTFSFTYTFFPRSEEEANNVDNIIKTFKFHMHPEYKDTNSFLYLYPSEFDIHYYTNDKENDYIHQHTSCVLTEMAVNYTPNGNFTTFSNGMPSQISITLSFKELSAPTKETIAKPFSTGGL